MKQDSGRRVEAYKDTEFLASRDGRAIRILAENLEPLGRFNRHEVADTIMFMGSARTLAREVAKAELKEAKKTAVTSSASRFDSKCRPTTRRHASLLTG